MCFNANATIQYILVYSMYCIKVQISKICLEELAMIKTIVCAVAFVR